jgi:hypothetical protein
VLRRSRIAFVLVALLAVLAAGCGGDDDRSDVAEQVSALCDEARVDIEALGLPSEVGIAVIRPWANRGTRLAEDIRAIEGGSASEQETLDELATALDEYYAGLRLGHTIYQQTRSSEAYAQTIERAKAFQADADAAATELGATECTRRPFDGAA